MYEEFAPARKGAFRDGFLIVVAGFVLLSLPNWLGDEGLFGFPYVKAIYELLILGGICFLVLFFTRRYAVQWKYSLVGTVLRIRSRSGGRENTVFEHSLGETTKLIPVSEASDLLWEHKKNIRSYCYGVSDLSSAYVLTFPPKEGNFFLIFQPSDKFVELLKQKGLDKSSEM